MREKNNQKVSSSTIIDRAKKQSCYVEREPRKASHDWEVVTNYIGEIVLHHFSYHLWSPPAREK